MECHHEKMLSINVKGMALLFLLGEEARGASIRRANGHGLYNSFFRIIVGNSALVPLPEMTPLVNLADLYEILVGMFILGANPYDISKDKRSEACLDDISAKSKLKSPINTTSYFSV